MEQKTRLTHQKNVSATDGHRMLIHGEQHIGFEGPIPHPDILRGYKDIDTSFPDRIFMIAENHAATEDANQTKLVKGNIFSVILGQILSFLFGILGLGAMIYLGLKGFTAGALASALAVIVQSVISGIVSRKSS